MSNRTIDFRQLVELKAAAVTRTPQQIQQQQLQRRDKHDESSYDLFTKEAYRIYQHISSLKRFLITIRPVYLSAGKRPTSRRPNNSNASQMNVSTLNSNGSDSLFAIFSGNIHNLTDRERDEIDFQAKVIIRRCIDRIKELEESEKIRQHNEASRPTSRFVHFLESLTKANSSDTMAEDVLFVHRSSMTWFLNQQLMQVSEIQKEQQEIRLTREIEKSENQLSKSVHPIETIASVYHPPEQQQQQEENPFEEALSQEQIQMLEKENSIMLEDLNNTLNQVKSAEKALLEISTLQTQLTNHLAAQTIQTDKLYADAIATTDKVEQGNIQLISARERNKSSRNFMLIFLISASFVLLFLDWYS